MQIILRILKETGIAILLLGVLVLVGFFLFRKQVPFLSSDIPNAVTYAGITASDYDIKGDLEDETDPTKTYTASNTSLRNVEKEYRILTGSANPFSSSSTTSDNTFDLPTEIVTIENEANPDYSNIDISSEGGENVSAPASEGAPAEAAGESSEKSLE